MKIFPAKKTRAGRFLWKHWTNSPFQIIQLSPRELAPHSKKGFGAKELGWVGVGVCVVPWEGAEQK